MSARFVLNLFFSTDDSLRPSQKFVLTIFFNLHNYYFARYFFYCFAQFYSPRLEIDFAMASICSGDPFEGPTGRCRKFHFRRGSGKESSAQTIAAFGRLCFWVWWLSAAKRRSIHSPTLLNLREHFTPHNFSVGIMLPRHHILPRFPRHHILPHYRTILFFSYPYLFSQYLIFIIA